MRDPAQRRQRPLGFNGHVCAGHDPRQLKRPSRAPTSSSLARMKHNVTEADLARLTAALENLRPQIKPSQDPVWSMAIPFRVVDCVLSLGLRYDSVVAPRVQTFQRAHPDLTTLAQLQALIQRHPTPALFLAAELRLRNARRTETLGRVVEFLLSIAKGTAEDEQAASLRRWAEQAGPHDHRALGIRGFALVGFQYLRMLLGASTIKPDRHLQGFVAGAVGHRVTEEDALHLLETACAALGLSPKDLDTSIWEMKARSQKPQAGRTCPNGHYGPGRAR